MEKRYCSYCGTEVFKKDETEDGIFCPLCHNDFWWSETLPENWEEEGYTLINEKLGGSMKKKICPICKKEIIGYPALSRKDNKTEICSDCGQAEALGAFFGGNFKIGNDIKS